MIFVSRASPDSPKLSAKVTGKEMEYLLVRRDVSSILNLVFGHLLMHSTY